MKKKTITKRLMVIALSLIMVLGAMPMTAFAAGYGDQGYDTSHQDTYVIDGNIVFVYITGNGGTVTRINGGDDDSVQQYRATADENWEFAYWSTYYVGPSTQASNTTAALGYYYFSVPGDKDTPYSKTNAVIQINEEMWAQGVYYLQAIFEPKVTVSINDPTNTFTKGIWGNSPATTLDNVFFSDTTESVSGYVPYGATIKVRISAFSEQYAVESITVHDGSYRNDFTYEINAEENFMDVNCTTIKRPTNVTINIKKKEQIIDFDANGGTGSMTGQTFEYGVAQALTANSFTKTGYTFSGWNTKKNGSGTGYTDKQAVSFTPANDGESITLYAQWTSCSNHQWDDGECTECGTLCSHSGGTATCTEPATCVLCGKKYGGTADHDYGTKWKFDHNSHWYECSCGFVKPDSSKPHYGGTATCENKAICDACGTSYGNLVDHTYGTEWKSDGDNHWHECSCGAKSDETAHSGGTATCEKKAVCTDCGAEYGNLANHTYATEWTADYNCHWYECSCGYVKPDSSKPHYGGTATCENKAICDACGTSYGNLADHTYRTEWKSDGNNHWHECSCGAKSDETAHSGGTATCEEKAVCSACGTAYGELIPHAYRDGKCTVCKAIDPNYVPETDSPQTGDNSHMMLWSALLFISGGAVIARTLIDRKRITASK